MIRQLFFCMAAPSAGRKLQHFLPLINQLIPGQIPHQCCGKMLGCCSDPGRRTSQSVPSCEDLFYGGKFRTKLKISSLEFQDEHTHLIANWLVSIATANLPEIKNLSGTCICDAFKRWSAAACRVQVITNPTGTVTSQFIDYTLYFSGMF